MAEQSKAMLVEYKFTRSDGRPLTARQRREMDDSMFELIGGWAQERGLAVEGQALFEQLTDEKQDDPLPHESMPALERLDRACRAVSASIAEFGTITDGELINELDGALDGLAPIETAPDPAQALEVQARSRQALRNIMLLAVREASRGKRGGTLRTDDWMHVLRFCSEAGVRPSPLREANDVQ